jgi:hypothetical protein
MESDRSERLMLVMSIETFSSIFWCNLLYIRLIKLPKVVKMKACHYMVPHLSCSRGCPLWLKLRKEQWT